MEWRDEGVLLVARPHGEGSAIIEVLTATHGRTAGVVRGGASRKMAPHLQPGAQLDVTWKARLEDHLGSYTVEPIRSRAATLMSDRRALLGLQSVCGLLSRLLPEREEAPDLYQDTTQLFDLMAATDAWPLAYLRWELSLLETLGYGLDLSTCAVTGATEGLVYVSPKSGRAVSEKGAGEWASKLLPMPKALLPGQEGPDSEISEGLETTGFFMAKALGDREAPDARRRLRDLLAR
ncbi:MAG: DNA repair protein RecO [Rhodobacteraceae bacterium]|nr:DNA repair protein RecO [Paracoccaceae bacterium]